MDNKEIYIILHKYKNEFINDSEILTVNLSKDFINFLIYRYAFNILTNNYKDIPYTIIEEIDKIIIKDNRIDAIKEDIFEIVTKNI